ncbi:uncharacterized protein Z520_01700 [Fonsecaea multimorphosa CBS 102226]|uniref:Uncharacterized protein n=1 Tax=Fonsecaea multimorphosa CBS 102226 TaxID=1442371 RepID=A0A0D2KB39_9EURO|nr:uncharacterized protein Z520_01700 [Fonsecaea multimorphosa CBS 102226]KIY03233.1 hypothetical protein Z520_01700 [Fonsecaea multimorphosa CBS 102226]OAL30472.1 hypothetical protein AYO22_01670 [Fonsecaea multimorphosa]
MGKKVEAVRNSVLSEERVYDSSDEDENEQSSEQETPKPKSKSSQSKTPNGIKTFSQKTSQRLPSSNASSSATASDNDTEEDEDEEQDGVEDEVEDEEDDSDNESASTPSPSSSRKRLSPGVPETPSSKRVKTTTRDKVSIPPKPFQRPKGYEPLTWSASDYASDMDLFDDLSNKQIWHISVPSSVSIDSIKELDIEAVLRGQPILSRNGIDYGMNPLPSKDEVILLPHGSDGKYKQCARKIERSFLMREVDTAKSTSPSKADNPQVVFTATQIGAPKQIRKQPEGLKMRYVPYGVSPSQVDREEDVEMRDTLHIPPDVDAQMSSSPVQSRKARRNQTNGEAANEKSPEKKLRGADDTPASSEKKKKKKRKLVDEKVL